MLEPPIVLLVVFFLIDFNRKHFDNVPVKLW